MITLQNIEISWTKKARGGKLATLRNSIPHVFDISFDKKTQRVNDCISVSYGCIQIEDTETSKLISVISNLFFEVENNSLIIKIPKNNGFDKKIAILNRNESIQFIRFSKSMSYEFMTIYKKSIINLVFSDKIASSNHFINQSFKYQFDEKHEIWK